MNPNQNMTPKEKELFHKIRALLTPDLIPEKFRDNKVDSSFYGHCYHASLALYKLLGGKEAGYKIKCGIDSDNIKHYWIEVDDRIIDPTIEQYTDLGRELPYKNLSKCDYRPSKSTKILIKKLT